VSHMTIMELKVSLQTVKYWLQGPSLDLMYTNGCPINKVHNSHDIIGKTYFIHILSRKEKCGLCFK
jgi:hypothetical protein